MAKPNKKGRSDYQSFVRIDRCLINSEAYRSLSPCARALHVEIKHRFNGRNNGEIALGERQAAERVGVSRNTVRKAFGELEERGFIQSTLRGAFTLKHRQASLWALTDLPYGDALPSKDFMRWRPAPKFKTQAQILSPTGASFEHVTPTRTVQTGLTGSNIEPVNENSTSHRLKFCTTFIIPGGGVSRPSPKTIELTPKPRAAIFRSDWIAHHLRGRPAINDACNEEGENEVTNQAG